MTQSPQDTLRAWLPHLLMLALLGLAVWLLAEVFAPIRDPILLAASLTALTYPLLFEPIHRGVCRLLPRIGEVWQRRCSALAATAALLVIIASPLLLLLLSSLGSIGQAVTVLLGLLKHDPAQIASVIRSADHQVETMLAVYPRLPLQTAEVHKFLSDLLSQSDVGPAFLGFLFKGTGGLVAHFALAAIALFYFYDQAPYVVSSLLDFSPLDPPQREQLRLRFRSIVFRLASDTFGTALCKGLCMGVIAWAIADFNFFLITAVTTFIALLPVVGFTFVWLPLASLLWAQHQPVAAVCLGVASLSAGWLVQWATRHLTRTLDPRGMWMGFMLFLGLIGGLLAFGIKGFVVGPTAVVITAVLGSFWLPLYGIGKASDEQSGK